MMDFIRTPMGKGFFANFNSLVRCLEKYLKLIQAGTPKIVLTVEGSQISAASTTADVLVVDLDFEGHDPSEWLRTTDGDECRMYSPQVAVLAKEVDEQLADYREQRENGVSAALCAKFVDLLKELSFLEIIATE